MRNQRPEKSHLDTHTHTRKTKKPGNELKENMRERKKYSPSVAAVKEDLQQKEEVCKLRRKVT